MERFRLIESNRISSQSLESLLSIMDQEDLRRGRPKTLKTTWRPIKSCLVGQSVSKHICLSDRSTWAAIEYYGWYRHCAPEDRHERILNSMCRHRSDCMHPQSGPTFLAPKSFSRWFRKMTALILNSPIYCARTNNGYYRVQVLDLKLNSNLQAETDMAWSKVVLTLMIVLLSTLGSTQQTINSVGKLEYD